jgi:hypothetical protein
VDVVLATVGGDDPAALLSTMLEGVEAQVGDVRRLRVAVHAEDAAGVVEVVVEALAQQRLGRLELSHGASRPRGPSA